jgi:hypothetical protein
MHKTLAMALMLALVVPAVGANGPKAVAPFLDEQTFVVARFDLSKLDADGLATALRDLGGIGAEEATEVKGDAGLWLAAMNKAGARELYAVFSLADYPNVPFVVVPLGDGADAQAIARLLDLLRAAPQGPREKIGGAVFAGTAAARARLRTAKPASRPELAEALAAAGDSAVQVALIPPSHLARIVEELMPTLPRELGEEPSKVVTRGVKWAAVGLDPPPKLALRVTIQSPDAAGARSLNATITKVFKGVADLKGVQTLFPDLPRALAPLEPKVEGDHVLLSLDAEATRGVVAPLVRRAVAVARRIEVGEHLKQIVLSLYRYVDDHHSMPAVATFDKAGKPLLSWRVHLLPYIGQEKLYKEFHLDEPWDSDHNKKLLARMPDVFRGPSRRLRGEGKTVYLAPVGKDTAFTGGAGGRRFPTEFTDGTSNTILIVQADEAHAVEWTRPEDLKIDLDSPAAGLDGSSGAYVVGLADGTVHHVKPTISKETLRAAFTANGGEVLGADWE